MRELIYTEVRDHCLLIDPVLNAQFDIAHDNLHRCICDTGVDGIITETLDGGSTKLLNDLPIKISCGHRYSNTPSDTAYTSNDYEYMLQYNQTILHHLDSNRIATQRYTPQDLKNGNWWDPNEKPCPCFSNDN